MQRVDELSAGNPIVLGSSHHYQIGLAPDFDESCLEFRQIFFVQTPLTNHRNVDFPKIEKRRIAFVG